jgi:hypothetical protein
LFPRYNTTNTTELEALTPQQRQQYARGFVTGSWVFPALFEVIMAQVRALRGFFVHVIDVESSTVVFAGSYEAGGRVRVLPVNFTVRAVVHKSVIPSTCMRVGARVSLPALWLRTHGSSLDAFVWMRCVQSFCRRATSIWYYAERRSSASRLRIRTARRCFGSA